MSFFKNSKPVSRHTLVNYCICLFKRCCICWFVLLCLPPVTSGRRGALFTYWHVVTQWDRYAHYAAGHYYYDYFLQEMRCDVLCSDLRGRNRRTAPALIDTDDCSVVFPLFRCEYLWCATYKIHGPFTAVLDLLKGFEAFSSRCTDRATSSSCCISPSTAEYSKRHF